MNSQLILCTNDKKYINLKADVPDEPCLFLIYKELDVKVDFEMVLKLKLNKTFKRLAFEVSRTKCFWRWRQLLIAACFTKAMKYFGVLPTTHRLVNFKDNPIVTADEGRWR